jgi:hypothetical protein
VVAPPAAVLPEIRLGVRAHDLTHLVAQALRQPLDVGARLAARREILHLAHVADVSGAVVDARIDYDEDAAAPRAQRGERRAGVRAGRHAEEVDDHAAAARELVGQHADDAALAQPARAAEHEPALLRGEHLEAVAAARADEQLVEARGAERLHHDRERTPVVAREAKSTEIEVARVGDHQQAAARIGGELVDERARLELERARHLVARARMRAARHLGCREEEIPHCAPGDTALLGAPEAIAVDAVEVREHRAPTHAQSEGAVGERASAREHEPVRQTGEQRDEETRRRDRRALDCVRERAAAHCA